MARAFPIQLTDAPTTSARAETKWPRWRVIAIRALYAPLAAYALLMASGAVQVGSAESAQRYAYLASTPWKLLSLGGALVILRTAGRSVLATQMLAVGLACWTALSLATLQHGSGLLGTLVLSLIFLVRSCCSAHSAATCSASPLRPTVYSCYWPVSPSPRCSPTHGTTPMLPAASARTAHLPSCGSTWPGSD